MKKTLLAAALVAAAFGAHAQTKKELVQKVLALQQPGIEALARQLVEQPAAQMLQQAGIALQQRVPADQREAVAKDIQADARKYVEDTVPGVRKRAVELAPTTVGTVLEEKFSEDELKQLIGILESPVNKRFQSLAGDMQKSLTEKLVAESRPTVEPKLRDLEQTVAKRLGATAAPAAAPASAARPAPAAASAAASKVAPKK